MEDAAPQPRSRIFISYRREDSSGHVLALLPALRRQFGANRIFKDTDNIPPGEDFLKFIKHELESCSVLLAIIGREWLTIQDPRLKRRRLDNPDDFLRVEVGTALKRDQIRVIPVLVERATMPSPDDLPPDLSALSYRNAIELSDLRWDSDVQLLIDAIERATAATVPVPTSGGSGSVPRPELVELQKRRARDIAGHLAAARQAMESQEYELALEACEKVLLLDPDHRDALELLDRARAAIDERKIAAWLQQAQVLLSKGEIGDSSDLIDQALAVDNNSEAALALRKEMLNYRREREREREKAKAVRAALDQARACFDDGDFESAIRYADDALTHDPEAADVRDIREKAQAALQERRAQRELKRRAQQAVSDARELMNKGDSAGAVRLLGEFTPSHELVTQALQDLQADIDSVEARLQRIQELTTSAAEAVARRQFDTAVALLSEAVQLDPQRGDIVALLADATTRQHAAASAHQTLSEAAACVERHDYQAARQLVDTARSQDPDAPDIAGWLRRIDDGLAAQAAIARRDDALRGALEGARSSLATGDLAAAMRHVEAALALDPTLAEAHTLGAQVRTALAAERAREDHDRRAVEAAEHARRLFDAEDYSGAFRSLEGFSPPHPRVQETLATLREELRGIEARRRQQAEEAARRQQELERARAARARAETFRRILTRGEANLEKNDHAAALRDAEEALEKDPESTAARDLRARSVALRERLEREEKERREHERQEQERQKRERLEQEQRKQEQQQQERLARERQERERKEQERKEQERKEQERKERDRRERERRAQEERERAVAAAATPGEIERAVAEEPVAAPSAGGSWRLWLAAAAAAILATAIGLWYYNRPSQTGAPPPASTSATSSTPAPVPSEPSVKLPEQPPARVEPTAPPASSPSDKPDVSKAPTEEDLRRQELEKLRATARTRYAAGQRAPALEATVAALAIDSDDPASRSLLDQMLEDAVKAGQQSKRRAIAAEAPRLATETYGRAVKLEEAGILSRAQDQPAATRSFWAAADRFEAAAREARETAQKLAQAKQPETEIVKPTQAPSQQRPPSGGTTSREPQPGNVGTTPTRPSTEGDRKAADNRHPVTEKPPVVEPPRPPVIPVNEESRIRAVIDRYEAGYDHLDPAAVRSVYPKVRPDLPRIFSTYQFYRLEKNIERITVAPDNQSAVARCTFFHTFRPKINSRDQQSREVMDVTLQKQSDNWVIVDMRKR